MKKVATGARNIGVKAEVMETTTRIRYALPTRCSSSLYFCSNPVVDPDSPDIFMAFILATTAVVNLTLAPCAASTSTWPDRRAWR